MIEQEINFGGKTIPYQLRFTDRKTLGIQVQPSGSVIVTAPMESDRNKVNIKVARKAPWILKQISTFNTYRPIQPSRRYVSGESHLYLGRQYRLKVIKNPRKAVKVFRGKLEVHSPTYSPASIQKQLDEWYTMRSKDIFTEIMDSVLNKFSRYLKVRPPLYIRKMSTRWGSCTPAGCIILNRELVKAPKGCIEYVVVHELCHLVHHDHGRQFYGLLRKVMPDWERRKGVLERLLT